MLPFLILAILSPEWVHNVHCACVLGHRFGNMSDATKAMQQIDGLEIANQKISVKIAALSPAETAAAAVAAAVDLDDDEGTTQLCMGHA